MSSVLYVRPVTEGIALSDDLKRILSSRLDRTLRMDKYDLGYLNGLNDAGIKGADQLIKIIEKYGEVELWEGY